MSRLVDEKLYLSDGYTLLVDERKQVEFLLLVDLVVFGWPFLGCIHAGMYLNKHEAYFKIISQNKIIRNA